MRPGPHPTSTQTPPRGSAPSRAEQPFELGARGRRVADVVINGLRSRGRIPGRPHLVPDTAEGSPTSRAPLGWPAWSRPSSLRAGPYSLALSAQHDGDATRTFRDGVSHGRLVGGARPRAAFARQSLRRARSPSSRRERRGARAAPLLPRGSTTITRSSSGAFRDDPLLGARRRAISPGCGPCGSRTIAHALLRAFCGQLITVARGAGHRTPGHPRRDAELDWLPRSTVHDAPRALSPAELRRLGLHARRGATLLRICRSLDLERLRDLPTETSAAGMLRERGLGPWSLGVVSLEGLGR